MDDVRLKEVKKWDYSDEWLERIRDIRLSEKRYYRDRKRKGGPQAAKQKLKLAVQMI
jgi:hypothetical protein